MPQTLLSLNHDVLSSILPLVSSHDAAQLALTSRPAYALAFPRFLSDVSLGGLYHKSSGSAVSQLTAFCNFVLSPAPSWHGPPSARLDGLRSLEIMRDAVRVRKDGAWTVDASAVALLSSVLERAPGLQKLTLWGSEALFTAFPDFGLGSSPAIHTLVLGGGVAPLPALARAFPRVRTLEFIAGAGSCAPDWTFSYPDSDPEAFASWRKTLEHVDTGFPILPLACPVRRVQLRNPVVSEADSVLTAREFLGRTRPVVLSTAVSAYAAPEEIGAVLERAASGLRFLDLVGDRCEGLKDGADWVQTRVVNALSLLPTLSLYGISISVTPSLTPAPAPWKVRMATPEPPRPEQPVDLAAIARWVAGSVPSLQFVAIDLSAAKGAGAAERAWFRVYDVKNGSVRKVVKMNEEDGLGLAAEMRRFNRFD